MMLIGIINIHSMHEIIQYFTYSSAALNILLLSAHKSFIVKMCLIRGWGYIAPYKYKRNVWEVWEYINKINWTRFGSIIDMRDIMQLEVYHL